jgi:alkylation response protein AidB-like acyl-CoA dehydrogenase
MTQSVTADLEDVESFRLRARAWLAANMPRLVPGQANSLEEIGRINDAMWPRARELQRLLYDGGFAGICYPREYGGLGLTPAHQRAFNAECAGYEMPLVLNTPTFSICGPTILDMGSEEQKRQHLPAVIRGEEILVQFLSEPGSGSDLASVTTRADRDGDSFTLSGTKIWSSAAYAGDYALCLARTDWDKPKHEGLTMFLVNIRQPGVDIRQIKQVDGSSEFCQEFIDGVEVPATNVVGEVNGGWAVASRQLFHERSSMGGTSPYISGPHPGRDRLTSGRDLIGLARAAGRAGDPAARELVAEYYALDRIETWLGERIGTAIRAGQLPPPASSVARLFSGTAISRRAEIALEIVGPQAVMSGLAGDGTSKSGEEPRTGVQFIARQGGSLGGGSTEIARNIISERLLGMPREFAADKGVPFNQVKRGR